jgi:acetyl esterase/lipase
MASWLEPVSDAVAAEALAFNEKIEKFLANQASIHTIPASVIRAARAEGKGMFGNTVFVDGATWLDAPVKLRVLRPPGEAKGIYLHIHGGGWTLGGADQQDVYLAALAKATGLVAASVEYRLAPEDPFPAGADDCEAAARWLLESGAKALDAPARFAIGGESAGAHLAVVTLQRLQSRAFYAANLVYGQYDLSGTPSVRSWGEHNLILSGPIIEFFGTNFLPKSSREERRRPDVSPLFGDLRAMPPALFTVGALDPLLDDTLFMEARWRAAGNSSTLRVWPHAVHAFNMFPIELARMSDRDQFEFLASRLA